MARYSSGRLWKDLTYADTVQNERVSQIRLTADVFHFFIKYDSAQSSRERVAFGMLSCVDLRGILGVRLEGGNCL